MVSSASSKLLFPLDSNYGAMPMSTEKLKVPTVVQSLEEASPTKEEAGSPKNGSETSGSYLLSMYAVAMLVSSVANSILFKRMTTAMPNYSAFLTQVSTVLYVPIFAVVCGSIWMSLGIDGLGGQEVLSFPLHKFAVMGLLDGAAGVLMMVGGIYTSGGSQVVLSQCIIPVTLVLCKTILSHKYHRLQYSGAAVIMLGVLITKLHSILYGPAANSNAMTSDEVVYNLVFTSAVIPASLSTLYKEIAFSSVEMNVNYMQLWVAIWQFLVGFLLVPVQSLPLLGPQRVPLDQMTVSFQHGFWCLVKGSNFLTENCGHSNQPACDNCAGVWIPVTAYMAVNIAYNVFSLQVVKYGGATISFLISTLRLPLTTFAFCSTWVMGAGLTSSPTTFDYLGLAVLFVGLSLYRFGARLQQNTIPKGFRGVHVYATTLDADPLIVYVSDDHVRSQANSRQQYYHKLAVGSPLLAPDTRDRFAKYVPPQLPDEVSDALSSTMLRRYNQNPLLSIGKSNAGSVHQPSTSGGIDLQPLWNHSDVQSEEPMRPTYRNRHDISRARKQSYGKGKRYPNP